MEDFNMATFTDARLDHWFKSNQNVLLSGKHGVGKTARIQACFERHGLVQNETYLYFSASTLDPWVDLIGVPKEQVDEKGEKYLGIVRPQQLYKGNVVAIFFDEYNRSPKKVRNAVMELIQKKSINGMVFPNLKCVWAAVNPSTDDDIYDVEKIDPAQQDRFQVQVDLPYACDIDFFKNRYGDNLASSAIEWWNALPELEKDKISPRRLQYALDDYVSGGDMEFVLPVSCNIPKLSDLLKNGSVENQLKDLYAKKDPKTVKAWFSSINNCNAALKYVLEDKKYLEYFLPFVKAEKLTELISTNDEVFNFMGANIHKQVVYKNVLQNAMTANGNEDLKSKIRRLVSKMNASVPKESHYAPFSELATPITPAISYKSFDDQLKTIGKINTASKKTIEEKVAVFNEIKSNICANLTAGCARSNLEVLHDLVASCSVATLKSPDFAELAGVTQFLINKSLGTVNQSVLTSLANLLSSYGICELNLNNIQGGNTNVKVAACY